MSQFRDQPNHYQHLSRQTREDARDVRLNGHNVVLSTARVVIDCVILYLLTTLVVNKCRTMSAMYRRQAGKSLSRPGNLRRSYN